MRERGLCAFATGHAWVMLRDEEVELAGGTVATVGRFEEASLMPRQRCVKGWKR